MRMSRVSLLGAVALLALTVSGQADVTADPAGCSQMRREAQESLDAHKDSQNYNEAYADISNGDDACAQGKYDDGLAQYEQAIQVLGN